MNAKYVARELGRELVSMTYTQDEWERLKKESPNHFKDIPIDQLYITCEGCKTRFCLKDTDGVACKNCGMRWDKQSTW